MTKDLITTYLHLNASFSDKLGVLDGKAATVLYFASLQDNFYRQDISISFLQEVLAQININTPLTFGNGIAGIGSVIQWLKIRKIIDQGPGELLEEVENYLFKLTYSGKLTDLSIDKGLAGLGIYFVSRINSYKFQPLNDFQKFQIDRYQECIVVLVDQIQQQLEKGNILDKSLSIWAGYSGIYLFLHQVKMKRWYEPGTTVLLEKVQDKLIAAISSETFDWIKLEAFFILLYTGINDDSIKKSIYQWIKKAKDLTPVFENIALYAMLLKIIKDKYNIPEANLICDRLTKSVNDVISSKGIPSLFPFNINENSVPLGLIDGVSGTALPLNSLLTRDYSWLQLIGIQILY